MPELPEVETTVRGIKPHLVSKVISHIKVRQEQLRWPIETKILKQKLSAQVIKAVTRRAKYILIHVSTGTLVIHLGMSGTLKIVAANTPILKHDHFDVVMLSGQILRFNDPRRFGAVLFIEDDLDLHPRFQHLGPEPLSKTFTAKSLYEKSRKHRLPIKSFIMNAKVVVGVGNIYASESLFSANIHPLHPAHALPLEAYKKLHAAIQAILKAAIKKGGTTLKDFYQSDGKPGYFSQELQVYDRAGMSCFCCNTAIEAIRIGQRSSYYCPVCQKL